MTKDLVAVVLAGGPAARDESGARALLRVAGETIVSRALSLVEGFSPRRTVVVADLEVPAVAAEVGGRGEVVTQTSKRGAFGSGHALGLALEALGETPQDILIVYADRVLMRPRTLRGLLDSRAPGVGCAALSVRLDKPAGYSRIIRNQDGHVQRVSSDCFIDQKEKLIQEVICGGYWFDGPALKQTLLPPHELDRKYNVCEALGPIVETGKKALVFPLEDPDEAFGVFSSADAPVAEAVLARRRQGAERMPAN